MSIRELSLITINRENLKVFKNLAHSYEAEFSNLTLKMPDENGLFKIEPDTFPNEQYVGYLLYYQEKTPIGFCIASIKGDIKDIAEFYIIPAMRKRKFGSTLAWMTFDLHPGQWQVRQIDGAIQAIHFWRSVIKSYTKNQFIESVVQDDHWGYVTRQHFVA